MPLVQHKNLPSIERIKSEGVQVCAAQDIDTKLANIKIGFLNMMPDAALAATERQFLRLIGMNSRVNCFFYPFSIAGVERSNEARLYLDQHYKSFEELKHVEVDALVITGANVSQPSLPNELFWDELKEVLCWAKDNIRSTVCSCLATHAAAKVFYDIDRKHLGEKCWGVFQHNALLNQHVLLNNVKPELLMCHSRFNNISAEDFLSNNVEVLIQSEQAGVQLAAEHDMSVIYFQGHPEYDDISLLKEYKREIIRYFSKQREDYPPVPENYFNQSALKVANKYKQLVQTAAVQQGLLEQFPENVLQKHINNPWRHAACTMFSNWLDFLAN